MAERQPEHPTDLDASGMGSMPEFLERGEAAWQRYLRTGESRPAEEVIARLQANLDAKIASLDRKQPKL